MHLQNKWQDYVFDLRSSKDRRPTLKDVVEFVDRAAAVMSDPVYGSASMRSKRVEKTTTRVAYVATADVCCPICDDGEHSVPHCREFLNMSPNDRLDVALKNQICFMCLTPGHITRECSNRVKCQERKLASGFRQCYITRTGKDYVKQARRKGMPELTVQHHQVPRIAKVTTSASVVVTTLWETRWRSLSC